MTPRFAPSRRIRVFWQSDAQARRSGFDAPCVMTNRCMDGVAIQW